MNEEAGSQANGRDQAARKPADARLSGDAPWTAIRSGGRKRARIACRQRFLARLPCPDRNRKVARGPDPLIAGPAKPPGRR